MKATGIIRRIDDLGRIVIPKEIRKKLKINEGENIEIYIDDEEHIILKKYSILKNIKDISQKITDSIYSYFKYDILITDTSNVIAASGKNKKNYINKEISEELLNIIKRKESKIYKNINIIENTTIEENCKINLITDNGDINGLLIYIKSEEISEEELKILNISTNFLNKYLEE
jgi:AbrB family transcriptional regulator (stage V sporulation protein T)